MGSDPACRPGRRRSRGPDRLEHGQRRFDVLSGPSARGGRPEEGATCPERRTTPRHHRPDEGLGRSRGGLTCKIHLAGEGGCRPLAFLVTPGQWGDAPQMIEVLERVRVSRPQGGRPRTRPDHLGGDKAYSSRRNRRSKTPDQAHHPRTEGPAGQPQTMRQQGRPAHRLRRKIYKRPNQVERAINRLKNSRAVATRFGKRAYVPRHRHHRGDPSMDTAVICPHLSDA